MLKNILLFTFLLLASLGVQAEWKKDDKLKLGNPTTSDAVVIEAKDGGYLKKENGSDWLFSKDGVNEKKFGSGNGSGGVANYNNAFTDSQNANAEEGKTGWANSGGTFAIDEEDPLEGNKSFLWTPSTQDDYVDSPVLDFDRDKFYSNSCIYTFTYKGGDENLGAQIIDGDGDIIASFRNSNGENKLPSHVSVSYESIFFYCPKEGATANDLDLKFRLINLGASAAPLIKFDNNYMGTNYNFGETVLPDSFSFKLNTATEALSDITGEVIGTCVNISVGVSSCSFIGLTSIPNLSCTASDLDVHNVGFSTGTLTNTGVQIVIRRTDTAATTDTTISCIGFKTGADAKQQVQTYRSIPKVAQNINIFGAYINGSGVVSLENGDWIDGNCVVSGREASCNFNSGLFESTPICNATFNSGSSDPWNLQIATSSTSSITLQQDRTTDGTDGWNGADIICIRSTDFKMPVDQIIVIPNAVYYGPYDLSLSGSSWTSTNARAVFYTVNGNWRMRFNISGDIPDLVRTGYTVAVSGVSFSTGQSISVYPFANHSSEAGKGYCSSNTINAVHPSIELNGYHFSGDVELASKPTQYVPQ